MSNRMGVIEDILTPQAQGNNDIDTSKFNKDPLLILSAYKDKIRKFLKTRGLRVIDLEKCQSALANAWVSYLHAYAHCLLDNYGVPARIIPNSTQEEMLKKWMTPEIYAYIKAYGRCDEDKMRFMGHAGGEYDENGKTKSVDASSSNVFSPIVGNEEVAKEQLAVFWKQAIVDLEAQLETADEGKKVLLQADIVHAKKQLEEIKN